MTYQDAVHHLDSLAQFGWKLDLARIRRLCELAGHPERRFRSILVGGSAGKGSTCAILASLLRAAGLRVATAPKPHLHTHRERAQVDGELISEERFAALMERILPLAAQVTREEGPPTVFEVMTLLAFLHFAGSAVDMAVVEVGLGGRFDATNVLDPELSVITMIGLDHTDRLGETVEEIAFEKAGIIKPGRRVVTGAGYPAGDGALRVIEAAAAERGAPIRRLGKEILLDDVRAFPSHTLFHLRSPEGLFPDLRLPLVGKHQARNAALALAAALWLGADGLFPLEAGQLQRGLAGAEIPGRLQVVGTEPLLLVDAAHSPDRADALVLALKELYLPERPGRRLILVIGCSAGHAPETVVARLAPLAHQVIATRSTHPGAVPAAEIAAPARALGVETREVEPVAGALREARRSAGCDDLIVVTGSIFVVAEALSAINVAG
jgi:dihydrofolate synthase / folylpolyglutamate synthase